MKKSVFLLLGLALIFGLTLGLGVFLRQSQNTQTGSNQVGDAPIPPWQPQPKSATTQTAQGSFSVPAALVTPKELLFLYIMQSSEQVIPNVTVTTSSEKADTLQHNVSSLSVSKVESAGKLGGYDVGIIHATRGNLPGQLITLQITLPGANQPIWEVTPLKQATLDNITQQPLFLPIRSEPEIARAIPAMLSEKENLTIFSLALTGQNGKDVSPLFLQIDSIGVVSSTTEGKFNSLTGTNSEKIVSSGNEPIATPAPIEPLR